MESEARTKWSAADLLRTTLEDYARFSINVMHNDGVTREPATERLKISRNLISPEVESVLCESVIDPGRCTVSMGFALGWRIVRINGNTIVDHTGADSDVKTFAFFVPQQKIGAVIFTAGPDVGHDIIDKVPATIDPDQPVYQATLWQEFPANE